MPQTEHILEESFNMEKGTMHVLIVGEAGLAAGEEIQLGQETWRITEILDFADSSRKSRESKRYVGSRISIMTAPKPHTTS